MQGKSASIGNNSVPRADANSGVVIRFCLPVVLGVLAMCNSPAHAQPADVPNVVAEVRAEVTKQNDDPGGRPLPVAAHWAVGFETENFASDYQIELLRQGHHILPTLPVPAPGAFSYDIRGIESVMTLARWHAPLCFRIDQWENLLFSKKAPRDDPGKWRNLPPGKSPFVIAPDGKLDLRLSPFGAIAPWKEVGEYYTRSGSFTQVEELYPDPPQVIMLSNNEARRLKPKQDIQKVSKRFIDRYGTGHDIFFVHEKTAEGYRERYEALFGGLKEDMQPAWKAHTRFVGYNAFGGGEMGRWGGWLRYSLTTAERLDPSPLFWDGGSVSYYTHNWNASADYYVFSPQLQAMNWAFMLKAAYRDNPDFWFELSIWDGNSGQTTGKRIDKAERYRRAGQAWSPERYGGFIQYGMWMTRPRAVREFRGHRVPRVDFAPYFDALLAAVDRVWTNPVLTRFWRVSDLVPNPAHRHPFQANIPAPWKGAERWFMLDTSLDPPRPWHLTTELPVFTLARVRGAKGLREWLVYAESPLEVRKGIDVTIPDYGTVRIDATPGGVFFLIREKDHTVERVEG